MYNSKLNKSGKAQEYKGIYFKPLKLKDEDYYNIITTILSFYKNATSDINVIKMSYLKFLLVAVAPAYQNEINIVDKLQEILSYISNTEVVIIYKTDGTEEDIYFNNVQFFLNFGDIEINEYDFDKIREIVLEQNGVSMDYLNQYDQHLEESLSFIHRNNSMANFEEQLFSYCAYMRLPIDVVEETHTFYQFNNLLTRIRMLINFELFKPLESSGQISFKDGGTIEDWLSHVPKRGRYDDILVKKESFVDNNDIFKISKTK